MKTRCYAVSITLKAKGYRTKTLKGAVLTNKPKGVMMSEVKQKILTDLRENGLESEVTKADAVLYGDFILNISNQD